LKTGVGGPIIASQSVWSIKSTRLAQGVGCHADEEMEQRLDPSYIIEGNTVVKRLIMLLVLLLGIFVSGQAQNSSAPRIGAANSSSTTVMTIAAYLTLYIVGRVEFFEHLRPYFFTTDMDFWRNVFKPDIPWQSLLHNAFICGAYTTGLLLTTVIIFERKDIVT